MPATKPPYSAQFRQQMVELVHAGRSASELSREFGPHVTSILSWVHKAGGNTPVSGSGRDQPLNVAERQELFELRRKLRQVQMERDILAKATAWFANKGEQTFTASTR